YIPDAQGNTKNLNEKLYLLNITSYSWESSFSVSEVSPSPTASTNQPPIGGSLNAEQKLLIGLSATLGFIVFLVAF
ncbi:14162_t:CDS:1, partial [Acaulospora morrowiae]